MRWMLALPSHEVVREILKREVESSQVSSRRALRVK